MLPHRIHIPFIFSPLRLHRRPLLVTYSETVALTKNIVVAAALVTGMLFSATGTALAHGNQCGGASWYGPGFHGKTAASGQRFDQNAMTAAHKSLPFGTVVRVTDQRTGKSVNVTINDRGPFHRGRIIDLSKAAAVKLGIQHAGTGKVCVAAV
jgi:rare lipoprotein A